MLIHCDALPSVVRAYPVEPDGAGYKVPKMINILDGSKKNNWFRPADVCVAPDGSLFVTDWYDPGVGGHQQGDVDRGRVFRVAPPGVKYSVPKVNFATIEGNIEALKSPNWATRYIAWTNLHKMGAKAEPALLKMFDSKVPHERARALWLLGRIEGKGQLYVNKAISTRTRTSPQWSACLLRQLKLSLFTALFGRRNQISKRNESKQLAFTAVSREIAIAVRYEKPLKAAEARGTLAQHSSAEIQ